jgi:hypothetical protein
MAKHNRESEGVDQRGFTYRIHYPPDWLRLIRVSRPLPSGRRSGMILFRNGQKGRGLGEGSPIRLRITCPEQGVDLQVHLRAEGAPARRFMLSCSVPSPSGRGEERLDFLFEGGSPANLSRRTPKP